METNERPSVEETMQVIQQLIQNFVAEESGNKVTGNNMAGLMLQIQGAVSGSIRIKPQEETAK
jgi:hypothetical protein